MKQTYAVILTLLLFISCSKTPIEPVESPAVNFKPVLDSLYMSSSEVSVNDTLQLQIIVHDNDGDSLYVRWRAAAGYFTNATALKTAWLPPGNALAGSQYSINVSVHDGKDTLIVFRTVTITEEPNLPPRVDSLSLSSAEIEAGHSVNLHVYASDPDGDELSYLWTASTGTFDNVKREDPVWTSPADAATGSIHTLYVTVSDGIDSVSVSRIVTIMAPENNPPVIESVVLSQTSVVPGGEIELSATASDIDGDSLLFLWQVSTGQLTSATVKQTSWVIPADAEVNSQAEVSLTVSDGLDSVSTVRHITIVELPNNAPLIESVVFSRPEATPGGTLNLQVNATDPDKDSLTYRWQSTIGTVLSAYQPVTDLVIPFEAEPGTTADISVTVSDGKDSVTALRQLGISTGITLQGHAYYRGTIFPLAGVKVELLNLSATTDEQGFYQILFVPGDGTYDLLATKSGFDDYNRKVTVSESDYIVDISMNSDTETGTISGLIHTIDEILLGGMKITLLNPEGSLSSLTAVSAGDGTYKLSHIPPGERLFYVDNLSNQNQCLADTFALAVKAAEQSLDPRVKIYRDIYREVGTENQRNWTRVDCNVLVDSYQLFGTGGFMRMINLISIPTDAERLTIGFFKIIHTVGYQYCYYGLFNEKNEGYSSTFTTGNRTKEWTLHTFNNTDNFLGQNVYLQFWTDNADSQFNIFEIFLSYYW